MYPVFALWYVLLQGNIPIYLLSSCRWGCNMLNKGLNFAQECVQPAQYNVFNFFPLIDHAQNFRSQKAQFFAHLQFPLCGESAQWEGHALRVLCHGPIKTTIKHKRGVVGCTLQCYVLRIYIQATSCKKKVSSRSISTLSLMRHDDSLRFC